MAAPQAQRNLDFSIRGAGRLVGTDEGTLTITFPTNQPCHEVLLEFEASSIWVCGEGRTNPGSQIYAVNGRSVSDGTLTLRYGTTKPDLSGKLPISAFWRDGNGANLASQSCLVEFEAIGSLPGKLGEIERVVNIIHQRLRWTTRKILLFVLSVAAIGGYGWFKTLDAERQQDLLIRLGRAPGKFQGFWNEDFLLPPGPSAPPSDWDGAPNWRVQAHPLNRNNGVAVIGGKSWGMPKAELFNNEDLYDFKLEIEAYFGSGGNFSWVARAQRDGARGYVFTLRQDGQNLHMEGVVQSKPGVTKRLIPLHGFDIHPDCCDPEDHFDITMQFDKYSFRVLTFKLNNPRPRKDRKLINVELPRGDEFTFRDGYSSFRHGTLAFLEDRPGQNHPRVDFVYVRDAK